MEDFQPGSSSLLITVERWCLSQSGIILDIDSTLSLLAGQINFYFDVDYLLTFPLPQTENEY
ncbi:MAG: hypothetical protein LRY26_00405, partial [Bacilli bacterium]|nr:hypothetical protein [Bacilli bacterium]